MYEVKRERKGGEVKLGIGQSPSPLPPRLFSLSLPPARVLFPLSLSIPRFSTPTPFFIAPVCWRGGG